MSLADKLRFWRRNEEPPIHYQPVAGNRSAREGVLFRLRTDYPSTKVDREGHYFYEKPVLPRGALTKIATEVGCSRAYVARIAAIQGYETRRRG